ncbi:MAG: nucleotidyl transferase AbiEii/AbiGii toxin family protein [Myxococcota bacterium]|jgi:predicted nucleotidyltransferase component of viral defense system
MIPKDFITEWREQAPWISDHQVEQDLVISRAIVEIFNVVRLDSRLAFRGGTALYKLHLRPAARYSEDIDLVQVVPEPIGDTFSAIRKVLDPWLGEPRRVLKEGRVNLVYRFSSEDQPPKPLRLKIEINSREHFSVLGLTQRQFEVSSRWWSGKTEVTTFGLDELLATKLRALYQRKKGRDLFDLWTASRRLNVNLEQLVNCFLRYLENDGLRVSRAEFESNIHDKFSDPVFLRDIGPLLASGTEWDQAAAASFALTKLAPLIPGEAWKGAGEAR